MAEDLSIAEKTKIFDKFTLLDKNRDAYITFDEVHCVLNENLGFNTEQSRRMFQICDKNNDGKLRFGEFITFYQGVSQKVSESKAVFASIDTNNDGHVSVEEARAAFGQLGFSEDIADAFIHIYDIDKDGRLQYEEFVRLWNAF